MNETNKKWIVVIIMMIITSISIIVYPTVNSVITSGRIKVVPDIEINEIGIDYIKGDISNRINAWGANVDVRFWTINSLYLNDEFIGHYSQEYQEASRGATRTKLYEFNLDNLQPGNYTLKLKTFHVKDEHEWISGGYDVNNVLCDNDEFVIPFSHNVISENIYQFMSCDHVEYSEKRPILDEVDPFIYIEELRGTMDKIYNAWLMETTVDIVLGGEKEIINESTTTIVTEVVTEIVTETIIIEPDPVIIKPNWKLIIGVNVGIIFLIIVGIFFIRRRK